MNWLIKLLGGYTAKEYREIDWEWAVECEKNIVLSDMLREAQKNDHRDDKGRYTKEGDMPTHATVRYKKDGREEVLPILYLKEGE